MNHLELWGDIKDPTFSAVKRNLSKVHVTCSWDEISPRDPDHNNWSVVETILEQLRDAQLDGVFNFLNHDSGPFYTSLIEPDFPTKFATFCRHFITRFPMINDFSPIHDINLTSMNSYLNGSWAPHLESGLYFYKALLAQCKASVLGIREIRLVNPSARYIQTENIPSSNISDWSALDLIYGRVTNHHPLFHKMQEQGIREDEIYWFQDNQIKIDMIHLDANESTYLHAWERFQTPMVISESHTGTWMLAHELRGKSVPIEAVSLLNQFQPHSHATPSLNLINKESH